MNKTIIAILLLMSIAISQNVKILDNDDNETLIITDEGVTGSITIPEVGVTLGTTEQKLYKSHDRLVWDGSVLGTDDERGWSDGGTTVRLKTITDNVGIGVTSATSKLDVAGTVNSPDNFKIDGFTFLKNSHSTMLTDFGTILGSDAGHNYYGSSSSQRNDAIGYRALYSLVDGEYNTAIGWKALHNILDEERNTAIGYSAASNQTEYGNTTAIGSLVLAAGDITSSNTGVGAFTFNEEENGFSSTAVGTNALMKNNGGTDSDNTAIGTDCLKNNTTGKQNVGIGHKALEGNITGSNNVAIGNNAGNSAAGSANSGNVFIGYDVGSNAVCNNKLYIDNSSTSTPLIWGDFTDGSEVVRINGDLEHTGTITQVSDESLKQDVQTLENTIEKVQRINGISFDWNDEAKNNLVVNDTHQIGVLAQDVEKVYPEIVKTNNQGYKTVDYSKLSVILIEVLKEQQLILKNLDDYFTDIEEKLLFVSIN